MEYLIVFKVTSFYFNYSPCKIYFWIGATLHNLARPYHIFHHLPHQILTGSESEVADDKYVLRSTRSFNIFDQTISLLKIKSLSLDIVTNLYFSVHYVVVSVSRIQLFQCYNVRAVGAGDCDEAVTPESHSVSQPKHQIVSAIIKQTLFQINIEERTTVHTIKDSRY